jgi:hypothetical protein
MSEEQEKPTGLAQRNAGLFQPGHARYGGRKRTASQVRAMAEKAGIEPMEYMLKLLTVDVVEEVKIDAKGKERRVKVPVGHELKIDICKALLNFFHPRLNATQITGANEGPVELATLDLTPILANPELARAAQEIALALAEQEAAQCALPAPPAPGLLSRDSTGHWQD